jgi:hypothetical protein
VQMYTISPSGCFSSCFFSSPPQARRIKLSISSRCFILHSFFLGSHRLIVYISLCSSISCFFCLFYVPSIKFSLIMLNNRTIRIIDIANIMSNILGFSNISLLLSYIVYQLTLLLIVLFACYRPSPKIT